MEISYKKDLSDVSETEYSYSEITLNDESVNNSTSSEDSDSKESSYEEEETKQNFEWRKYTRQNKLLYFLPAFTQKVSLSKSLNKLQEPQEFFRLFFDDDVFENLCEYYDKYSESKQSHKAKTHKKWAKPDLTEMKCYFGMFLYMGIVKKPTIEHYWSTSEIFGFKISSKQK